MILFVNYFLLMQTQVLTVSFTGLVALGFWIGVIVLIINKRQRKKDMLIQEEKKNMEIFMSSSSQSNIKERLNELKTLLDEGAITQEEFDRAKAKLIDEI